MQPHFSRACRGLHVLASCSDWLLASFSCTLHFYIFCLFYDSDWKTALVVFQNSGNASEFGMTTVI